MPPKEPPAETAVAAVPSVAAEELEAIRAEAYQRGYDDGYAAAKPKPGMFEAARLQAVKLPATYADNQALIAIDAIMEQVSAEYGEKFPRSDRELLFAAWARSTKQRERAQAFPPGQRVSKQPPSGPPNVEYELVQ